MTPKLIHGLLLLLLCVTAVNGQTTSQPPFASLERAVKSQRGGCAGDKSKLSAIFSAERRQLGDNFEAELLKWLGKDVEKHYWISFFLESDDYLHGDKRLPYLALVKEQGLSLVRDKDDEESEGYVVGLSITAATLSAELGISSLAISYKDKAESLLRRNSDLSAFVPAMYEAERRLYDNIRSVAAPSTVAGPPTITADPNPAPYTRVSGGILNGKAVTLPKPTFPLLRLAGEPVKVKGVLIYNFVP